jgi:hypothetical protein
VYSTTICAHRLTTGINRKECNYNLIPCDIPNIDIVVNDIFPCPCHTEQAFTR